MNIEQIRADFEMWCHTRSLDIGRDDNGDYISLETYLSWDAYQAGRAAQQSQDREDAERYRWLRDPCSGAEHVIFYSRGDYGKGLMSGEMLDEAIDHARGIDYEVPPPAEPACKTDWNNELSSWSDEDFVRIFHECPDLANRLRKMLAEPVKRKRPYAQGSALGELGVIPVCDQINDEPVRVTPVAVYCQHPHCQTTGGCQGLCSKPYMRSGG